MILLILQKLKIVLKIYIILGKEISKFLVGLAFLTIITLKIIHLFLKDFANSCIYNAKGDAMCWHRHILLASNFHIKTMRLSYHFYLDGTFLSTKKFYQILILMYYDESSCKKVPGSYFLINFLKYIH